MVVVMMVPRPHAFLEDIALLVVQRLIHSGQRRLRLIHSSGHRCQHLLQMGRALHHRWPRAGRCRFFHADGADLHRPVERRLTPLIPKWALFRGKVEFDLEIGQTPGKPCGAFGAVVASAVVAGPAVVVTMTLPLNLRLGAFGRRLLGKSDMAARGYDHRDQNGSNAEPHRNPPPRDAT